MSFTTNDFPKLLDVINTHPEWRQQLVKVLFPNVDLAQSMRELKQALKELAQAQARTEQSLRLLTKRADEAAEDRRQIREEFAQAQARNDQSFKEAAEDRRQIYVKLDEATEDRQQIRIAFDAMHQDVAKLKGLSYERTIRDIAASIFGSCFRRGKDVREKISDRLYEGLDAGKISKAELEQVIAVDLLWAGRLHPTGTDILLVIEASWTVETNDLERVITRASILRTLDINALPVVAGNIWNDKLFELALERGVVVVEDKRIYKDTWNSALRGINASPS